MTRRIGWSLLFLEFLHEGFFHTWSISLEVDATAEAYRTDGEYKARLPTRIFEDRKTHRPTAMAFRFKKPDGFQPGSGQWASARFLHCFRTSRGGGCHITRQTNIFF